MNEVVERARKIVKMRAKMLREEILPELGVDGMTKEEAMLLCVAELLERKDEERS